MSEIPDIPDPYLWLEDIESPQALAWVKERNADSERLLRAAADFPRLEASLREVLDSSERIPYVTRRGDWLYNLWQDAANPRGLWRRTSLAEYRKAEPAWDTVIDIDALGKTEGVNWVWGGANCLGPDYRLALVALSRGGSDAREVREFDLVSRRFVEGGFQLPEAKSQITWIDADQLYVATDFGAGSLTDSGYPRVIKRWRRGQALDMAVTVFEAEPQDVAAYVAVDATPGFERTVFGRSLDFYHQKVWLLQGDALAPIDLPADAQFHFDRERLLIQIRSDWTVGGKSWPQGSLLVTDAQAYLAGQRDFQALFMPTATRSLEGFAITHSSVLVNVLDNVASRVEAWRLQGGAWQVRELETPVPGTLSVTALYDPLLAADSLAEAFLLNASDFLRPDSLQLGHTGNDALELLKSRPSFFDASGMRSEQRFATSQDGTRVPYFVIWPKGAHADGMNPTLLYGYGGFEISLTPSYSGTVGRGWTSRGGVYAVANIRGGGEFGPGWHQAAIKAHKQRSYDDFAAVAEDLIATQVTSPAHLGVQGGSNGGLLVGAVMLQRPELFNAVVCKVPLLDMLRYSQLLAGASWMAEYGDPSNPEDWAVISRYSPYQNVRAGTRLPRVFFDTSTRDDRVHPGHARKMAARMLEQGHDVLYWENIEGGHGGAADNRQLALMQAQEFSFLWVQLGTR
jgi:prolyl oligopeptidase